MKTNHLICLAITLSIIGLGCQSNPSENVQNTSPVTSILEIDSLALIKQGNYLVNTLGCNDCHSPKVMTDQGPIPDPNRLLSGHDANETLSSFDQETAQHYVLFNYNGTAAVGPWGTSFAANLTPDPTGLGTWTKAQFFKAMREGKFKGLEGTRPLLPPMPWPSYAQMTDADLSAIFAYLKSIKPVENVVPLAIPPTTL
jgi:hypothetical protein